MKTSLKFLYSGIASLVAVTGFSIIPASAELANFDRDNTSADIEAEIIDSLATKFYCPEFAK